MLVLTRKVLEAAIAKLKMEIIAAKESAAKDIAKEQNEYAAFFTKGLAKVRKEIAESEAEFKDLLKNRAKYSTDQFSEKANAITTNFSVYDRYFRLSCSANHYRADVKESQIATLKGLLSMMEGDKLELSNSMAEKVLGKMDLLSLLG